MDCIRIHKCINIVNENNTENIIYNDYTMNKFDSINTAGHVF